MNKSCCVCECPQLSLLNLWAYLNSVWPKCFNTSSVSCVASQQFHGRRRRRLMVIVSLLRLYSCWNGSSSKGSSFLHRSEKKKKKKKSCLHCLLLDLNSLQSKSLLNMCCSWGGGGCNSNYLLVTAFYGHFSSNVSTAIDPKEKNPFLWDS